MKNSIEAGKTLLVDGPAAVTVDSGKVEVFGHQIRITERVVIRDGKRLPFTAVSIAAVSVSLGEGAAVEVAEGTTIPQSWSEALDRLRGIGKRPAKIIVVGGADSGKTSLCTYLINRLLAEGHSVALVDGDMGQADVGPPSTVAYKKMLAPVTDLFALKPDAAFFVGVTSPSEAVDRALEGLETIATEASQSGVDFVIVNTDGWVAGEDAAAYKLQLAEALAPDAVVAIQQSGELTFLLGVLKEYAPLTVAAPSMVRLRSREKRKSLRELGYMKYFPDAKAKTWSLKKIHVEPKTLCQDLQVKGGTLLGLHDSHGRFLGLGVLRNADCLHGSLRVWTSLGEEPAAVVLGKVRLDERLHELP